MPNIRSPLYIRNVLQNGYRLPHSSVLVHCSVPMDTDTQETVRDLIIGLEAAFTAIF